MLAADALHGGQRYRVTGRLTTTAGRLRVEAANLGRFGAGGEPGAEAFDPRGVCDYRGDERVGVGRRGDVASVGPLRPMGRATSGVIGMRFTGVDELLAMEVVRDGLDVLVATNGGFAKRTPIDEYPVQGRGGKGVLTAKITERRGGLVGAIVISPDDELFAITSNGGVIRTPVKPVRRTRDRNTMGVKLMDLPDGVTLVAIARNADEPDEQD